MDTNELIAIGKIVAPHGVRGDVRVVPLTDFPDRFERLKSVLLETGQSLAIHEVKYHKQYVLLRFAGMNDRNAVEAMKGKLLFIRKEDVMPLPEGHYYLFEIIGLAVYSDQEEYLGKISDVLQTGSNDVYVVDQEGKPPLLIPALKTVVQQVDVHGGRMTVKLQEEWQ